MATSRLHLGHLNISELIALAQQVHVAMCDNSAFVALESQVGGLLNEINEMIITNDGYQVALQMVQQRLVEQKRQRTSLENLLSKLAIGAEIITSGNSGLIPGAGFDVSAMTAPSASSHSQGKLSVGMQSVAATN